MLSDTALLSLATDFQSVNGLDIAQARRIIFLKKLHPNPSFLTHEQAIEMLHGENRRILQQQQQQQQMMMNGGGYGGQPAGAPPPYNDPYGQQQYPPQQQYNQQPYPQQQYPPQQQYNQSNQPYPSQPGNSGGGDALRRAQYEADRAKLRLEQERMGRQLDRRERQVSASERAFRVSLSLSLSLGATDIFSVLVFSWRGSKRGWSTTGMRGGGGKEWRERPTTGGCTGRTSAWFGRLSAESRGTSFVAWTT